MRASFNLATDGGVPQAGLYATYTKQGLDKLYGTTTKGGKGGKGTVFAIEP